MKRIGVLLLCICLVMTGCQGNRAKKQTEETGPNPTSINREEEEKNTVTPGPTKSPEETSTSGLSLDTEWMGVTTAKLTKTPYTKVKIEAKVPSYTIAKDLSNITNLNQFSGFTKEQIKLLVKNGFVVLPTRNTKMYYTYDSNEYSGVPNFITSDSMLHLYHQFYDKSLINIESNFLYGDLDLMTKQMLDKSIVLLSELKDEQLKKLQRNNVVYFLVARMLMQQSTELSVSVDAELLDLAKQEYALVQAAEALVPSPMIKSDVDYTMFAVRGHYTRTEELGRFFRTMMWFGTYPYALYNNQGEYQYDNVLQALLVSYTTFAQSEKTPDAQLWSNIYLPTSEYVGLSDDIDVFTMNKLRREVFGDQEAPDQFNEEEYYDRLLTAVKALPEPQIRGKQLINNAVVGKQFRFMGQRYILDSDILQDLVTPVLRTIPSALDVMGILGSKTAEDLQFTVYQPQKSWPDYTKNYQNWKAAVAGMTEADWGKNLYTGWLWTLKEPLKEYASDSGMPFFMTNDAWRKKSLNTALGSYAELKHDTVLYGKQAMAEAGGPIEYADYHYVEPEPELYGKLYYLTEYTVSVLKERGMLNKELLAGAEKYKELLKLLADCSKKELNNEPLTEEENKKLLIYGGSLEKISNSFLHGIIDAEEDYPNIEISDMLVSDISTGDGEYLSLGTGFFDDIYVIAPMNGKLYLCRGSVFSAYEFTSSKRLTDEDWWALNGITIQHEDFGDFPEFGEPSKDLPEQQEWVKTFKSDTNEVNIAPLEVDWEKLEE